jgi:hypothetical protein
MKRLRFTPDDRGAVLPLTALMIVVIIWCVALAIDLGRIYLVKCELQRAADAGAMAAALGLFATPPGTQNPVPVSPDCSRAFSVCQSVVGGNQADASGLVALSNDVTFGNWDAASGTFTPTGCTPQVNAVRVLLRKDNTANGPVPLFFAGLMPQGLNSVNLTAQAIGLSGYVGYVPPGAGAFPLAVDANKVPLGPGDKKIILTLNPTTTDGGCWQTFFDQSPAASDLRKLVDGTTPSPALKVGDQIRVTEGVADTVMQQVKQQFDDRVHSNQDYVVLVPVIPGGSHTGLATVQGFVALKLTLVDASGGDKRLEAVTVPDYVAPGVAPGGPNFGLWAGLPKLVQ